MNPPQKEFAALDQAIITFLVNSVPQEWWAFRMSVSHVSLPNGEHEFAACVEGGEGYQTSAIPPEALYATILKHYDVFQRYDRPWSKISYHVHFDEPKNKWCFEIDYTYV